jgi:hypothetical protein
MPQPKPRFTLESFRLLELAAQDPALAELHTRTDLQMLLSFIERFDKLGWIPPFTEEHQQLLAASGVTVHQIHPSLRYYEFCSKGARGEREPWITIFFHIDEFERRIRICGVEFTRLFERARDVTYERIAKRIQLLDWKLKRRRKEI